MVDSPAGSPMEGKPEVGRSAARLVVALPKGRLLDEALDSLTRAGYGLNAGENGRRLVVPSSDARVSYILAKPADVPVYVENGAADLGIVGLDVLRESQRDVLEPLQLPFGHCRLVVAGPALRSERPLRLEPNPRVATKFPVLTEAFFRQRGISAEIIQLSGSVELAPLVDLADLIVDLVQTGRTLRDNGLVELRIILESQAMLIANRAAWRLKATGMAAFVSALRDSVNPLQAIQESSGMGR
ncbi:MAG: ATP phosphoribosyltransferase [Chloroflexota bacterium]|nr:ATP phosphoribosyltransferase [Chloroflexota bacterium]